MPYRCRYPDCNAKVERLRKYCPECGRRMYKGDWVREPADASHIVKCAFCKGSGIDPVTFRSCRVCGGKGKVTITAHSIKVCDRCRGHGMEPLSFTQPCRKCKGKGKVSSR